MITYLAISLGALLGTLLRFFSDQSFSSPYLSTMLVNSLGSFGIGMVTTLFLTVLPLSHAIKTGVSTGFFGSLTTFSTFSVHSLQLLRDEEWLFFFLYNGFHLIMGLTLVWMAIHFIYRFSGHRQKGKA